ncbi:hypothetical protein RU639_001137 [Aspergillus parasiticus]
MLGDLHIPARDRVIDRVLGEGTFFLFAGTETTSRTLVITMFYPCSIPNTGETARRLENLQYLVRLLPYPVFNGRHQLIDLSPYTGVVHEGLLAYGSISCLSRVAIQESLNYKPHVIPCMNTCQPVNLLGLHNLYRNPVKFNHERWIKAAQDGVPSRSSSETSRRIAHNALPTSKHLNVLQSIHLVTVNLGPCVE